ncbi:MAG: hypothetical protein AUK35_03775 [Zetaproteobacteria bacterium CG2_30_46_52]|nr:MAG: hypothetical protein AUK35_03775 [Zetaproteobacteria bacterium CG2_30_46_52]
MMQAMYGQYEEDEIDLLEYWKIIWGKRKFIVSSSFLAAALAAVVSLLMPNIYRAEVLLAPVGVEDSKASSLLGGLGGFASLAGVSLGGGGSTEENLAVFKSRQFIWKFIRDEKLMPTLFEDDWDEVASSWKETDIEDQPSLWDAWRLLIDDNRLSTTIDGDSGLITLAVEWTDADLSAIWANKLVERLNQHLREYAITQSKSKLAYLEQELSRTTVEENRQALYGLISQEQKQAMLANTQQDFAFRVLDQASVPDEKVKPKRAIIVVLSGIVAGFLCIIFVFVQEGMRKRKEEMELSHES